MEFELHTAVDGKKIPDEYESLIDREGSRRDGRPIRMGSIANWISQRQVMQEMVENGPEVMTILEDDAVPLPNFPTILHDLESMTDRFDIAFLHFGPERPFVPGIDLSSGHQLGWLRWSHFGTQGYVITRRAAGIFLQKMPLVRTGIDRALASYWKHGLRTCCVRPAVVLHPTETGHYVSLVWQAPIINWTDPLWRLRRGWFYTKEGLRKRCAFTGLMVRNHGLPGLLHVVRPRWTF